MVVPKHGEGGRLARAFAGCAREALQPLSLGVAFGLAVIAVPLLRIPQFGGWLAAALLVAAAWGFQGLIRQSGMAMSGSTDVADAGVPPWREALVRLLLSVLAAAALVAPFVIRNGGTWLSAGRPLFGTWAVAVAFAAWWLVMPLILVTANAYDRQGPISPRKVWSTLLARPRGTLVALLIVPVGLVVIDMILALIAFEQGHLPLLVNNVFPTPSVAHQSHTADLAYRYDDCVWNVPFKDQGFDCVPIYLSGLRRGFTLLGTVPASLAVWTTRFDPTIFQTQPSVFLALRFVLAILGVTAAASVLGVQARCLGSLVAAGAEADIAASARTGLVAIPTAAQAAAATATASERTGLIPIPPLTPPPIPEGTPAPASVSASARTALIPIPPLPGAVSPSARDRVAVPPPGPQTGGPSVLIVDDEIPFSQALGRILSDRGFVVYYAANARDGLQLASAARPDLIMLDLLLPDRSGLEVCRTLRAQESTRHIPILMVSYRSEAEDEVSGLTQGADDYVTKPYVIDVLIARMQKQLQRRKNTPPGHPPERNGGTANGSRTEASANVSL